MRRCRIGLLIGSAVAFAIVILIVLIALTPSGNWLEIHQGSPAEVSRDGASLKISFSVEVDSNMPYDVEGLDIALTMADHGRGSSVPLCSKEGVRIASHGTTEVPIEMSVRIPTAALVLRDLAMKDGAPLHFDLSAKCRYLHGTASFELATEIDVPVAADGEKVSYSVTEDTGTSFSLRIDGLAGWLVPESRVLHLSGGGEEAVIAVDGSGSSVMFSVRSDSGLDGALERIASSDDFRAVDGEGSEAGLGPDGVRALDTALQYARELR